MESTLNGTTTLTQGLQRRWFVLFILAIARCGVGFQFVAIAALIPQLQVVSGFNHTQIGILLGVFLISGVVLSIPAGMIATRIGDHRTLRIGLVALILGGALVAFSDSFGLALAGRLLGGVGAVATSIVGSKQLTDWFIGREIRTAMSLFGLTWPGGIAIGMMILPILGVWQSTESALLATSLIPMIALMLVGFIPRIADNPYDPNGGRPKSSVLWSLSKPEFWTIMAGGLAWPLMNGGGYILFTTYGPGLLMERGATVVSAGLLAGMLSWLVMITIPIGGVIADRTGRNGLMFLLGSLIAAAAIAVVPIGGPIILWVVLSSALGFTVGPVMALPSDVLRSESRATGLGLYFSLFYLGMGLIPALGGWILDASGSLSMVIWLSALCLLLSPVSYFAARLLHQKWSRTS